MSGSHSKSLEPRVLAALRAGQMHIRMLYGALNRDYATVGATITELVRRKEVVILGSAKAAGYTDIRNDAPVYGLVGAKLVRVAAPPKTKTRGSGVVAGPITIGRGFRWGGGRL